MTGIASIIIASREEFFDHCLPFVTKVRICRVLQNMENSSQRTVLRYVSHMRKCLL